MTEDKLRDQIEAAIMELTDAPGVIRAETDKLVELAKTYAGKRVGLLEVIGRVDKITVPTGKNAVANLEISPQDVTKMIAMDRSTVTITGVQMDMVEGGWDDPVDDHPGQMNLEDLTVDDNAIPEYLDADGCVSVADAYLMGYEAARKSCTDADNPFGDGSELHKKYQAAWLGGHAAFTTNTHPGLDDKAVLDGFVSASIAGQWAGEDSEVFEEDCPFASNAEEETYRISWLEGFEVGLGNAERAQAVTAYFEGREAAKIEMEAADEADAEPNWPTCPYPEDDPKRAPWEEGLASEAGCVDWWLDPAFPGLVNEQIIEAKKRGHGLEDNPFEAATDEHAAWLRAFDPELNSETGELKDEGEGEGEGETCEAALDDDRTRYILNRPPSRGGDVVLYVHEFEPGKFCIAYDTGNQTRRFKDCGIHDNRDAAQSELFCYASENELAAAEDTDQDAETEAA